MKRGAIKMAMMGNKKKPRKVVANLGGGSSTEEPADPKRVTAPVEEARALVAWLRRWKK